MAAGVERESFVGLVPRKVCGAKTKAALESSARAKLTRLSIWDAPREFAVKVCGNQKHASCFRQYVGGVMTQSTTVSRFDGLR
jgi:hypothetical protein